MFESFEQIQIDTSGATIHLVKKGERFPLLLLHGYPDRRDDW
jgi:haloacetate dehalogenase